MTKKILAIIIMGLFLAILLPTPIVSADTWSGDVSGNNWHAYFNTGTYTYGPALKNLKYNNKDVFEFLNIPWFQVDGTTCGLYGQTPDANYPYGDATSNPTVIEYKYTSLSSGVCSYASNGKISQVDVLINLFSTGEFNIQIYTKLSGSTAKTRAHYVYAHPNLKYTQATDDSNNLVVMDTGTYSSTYRAGYTQFRGETSTYMEGVEYGYDIPRMHVQSHITPTYTEMVFDPLDYQAWNDHVVTEIYVNKCTSCGAAYGDNSQNTNGPWSYTTGESTWDSDSGGNIHLVTSQNTNINTYNAFTTNIDWEVETIS